MDLVAYFDDSGTDAANPFLVVGGFASDVGQWSKFSDELRALDCDFGAPPFHAKTFEKARHGHGPYAVWSVAKRHEYLNRFVGIIERRCFKSFGTLLEKAVYDDIIRRHEAFREYFYSPFVFAAVNTVHALLQWRDAVYPGRMLEVIFDKGNKNAGQLSDVAKRALVGSEKNVKDVSVEDDEEIPPLRAADLLAARG